MSFTPQQFQRLRIKDEPLTPDFFSPAAEPQQFEENLVASAGLRRSLSLTDLPALSAKKYQNLNLNCKVTKSEVIERYNTPQKRLNELVRGRYMSVAEQIYHYQRDTPERFHYTREPFLRPSCINTTLTVPQSPALIAKTRMRQTKIPTREEIEEEEIAEIRKNPIKAQPIPKAVFQGSRLPSVQRKQTTQPEPFKLSEPVKKLTPKPIKQEEFIFVAKPAPRDILEKPQKLKKILIKPTATITPSFVRKYFQCHSNERKLSTQSPEVKPFRSGPIKPMPFSFEQRDEEARRKRELKIREREIEERKMRVFHARPIPQIVKKKLVENAKRSETTSQSSENKENVFKFESKPPLVLHKKPFIPVRNEKPTTIPVPFDLRSFKRGEERHVYDSFLKEREAKLAQEKAKMNGEKMQQERRQIAEIRAKTVHHAQPVPDFTKPPTPRQKSCLIVTVPHTPTVLRRNAKA